jgi:hypothetical protein
MSIIPFAQEQAVRGMRVTGEVYERAISGDS